MDIEQPDVLAEYLRATGRIGASEPVAVQRLSGGVSSRTMLVERGAGEAWVVKQALARLRVRVEWVSDPRRVHREALGMRRLRELAPPGSIPEFLFEDREHHLVAMRAVPQPHENWKSLLLAGRVDLDLVEQFGQLLGTIHRASTEARAVLADEFADRSYFESLRLEPYYAYTAEQHPEVAPFLLGLIDETRRRPLALVHGDYSPKNILVHGGRLVLVDHEVIHFGDPAFDVGFALTHLLSKANHLPAIRARFAEAAGTFWSVYAAAVQGSPWAAEVEPFAVRHAVACLLARVGGRSPLEYLDEGSRARQRVAAGALTADVPGSVEELVDRFTRRI